MQLLTPEQLDQVKRIIQKHHAVLVLKLIGAEALTPSEKVLLESAGISREEIASMEDSYVYGKLLARMGEKAEKLSYEDVQSTSVKLSAPEERAVEAIKQHAGAHIRHLGARVEQQASMLVFREDATLRASLMGKTVSAVKANVEQRKSIRKLSSELRKRTGDWQRDWDRVAQTEKVNAMNQGQADTYAVEFGDPWVFKRPAPDACKHCFTEGTIVETRSGPKAIETIEVGDEVLTHKLRWRKVTEVIQNDYEGTIYGFNGQDPHATANHPYLVNLDWRRADAVQKGDYVIGLVQTLNADDQPTSVTEQTLFQGITSPGRSRVVPGPSVQLYRHLQARDANVDVVYADIHFRNRREVLESTNTHARLVVGDDFFGRHNPCVIPSVVEVNTIRSKEHKGTVYNLEVEEDESYFANGLAVHNCLRLHIGPDGHPRIFKLSTLQTAGSNAGKKAGDWEAIIGATHPHCQCQLSRVPPGWGFDKDSVLVPDGPHGVRYMSEEDMQKAVKLEQELQKAFEIKERVNVAGLPIAIEQRIGDLRHWKDPSGVEGATRMLFAYGYIEGTLGPDGDEYDVYVGPDPLAPFVYIVHQKDPRTGEYDEDKAFIGFPDPETAKIAYLAHYDSDRYFGAMSMMPIEEFRSKVGATRNPGSLQSDGMLKSVDVGVSGAQTSRIGDRAVATGGLGLAIGMGTPMQHLQAQEPTKVQITPEELVGERPDRTFGVYMDPQYFDRPDLMKEAVFPYKHDVIAEMHESAREEIPKNRFHLQAEIVKRLARVSPNYANPKQKRSLTKSRRTPLTIPFQKVKLTKSAGPFIGPRGGKWADPKHTIPWKDRKKMVAAPKQPLIDPKTQKRNWREGYPSDIQAPDFSSWTTGQRGGTEGKHWDAKKENFTPQRLKLHGRIKSEFLDKAKPIAKGQKPIALITMGGPGAGKSTMVRYLNATEALQDQGFVHLDPDGIKEQIPEYNEMLGGGWRLAAAAVHHESTTLMRSMKAQAVAERKNVVFDTTGADLDRMLEDIKQLRKAGYEVRAMIPYLGVTEGMKRVRSRAEATGRYVPPHVVKEVYEKVPKNVAGIAAVVDEFTVIDNRTDPKLVYTKRGDDHEVHDAKLVGKFKGLAKLAKGTKGKAGKLQKGASPPDLGIAAIMEGLKKEATKPHVKKYNVDEGDYHLALPMVDGLNGQILEGSIP